MRLPFQGAALHLNPAEFSHVFDAFSLAVANSFFLGSLRNKDRVGAREGERFLCLPQLNDVRVGMEKQQAPVHLQLIVSPSKHSRLLFADLDPVSKHTFLAQIKVLDVLSTHSNLEETPLRTKFPQNGIKSVTIS